MRLPAPPPWDESLSKATVPEIDRAMQRGIVDKTFSGCACIATVRGLPFHRAHYGQTQMPPPLRKLPARAMFDLGELTRVFATQMAVLTLAGKGRMDVSAPIGAVLKDFEAGPLGKVPIEMLFDHTSGLPASVPLYESIEKADKRVSVKERRLGTPKAIEEIRTNFTKLPLAAAPGTVTCVSSMGYLLLGWIVEEITKKPLDVFLSNEVYKRLNMDNLIGYSPLPITLKSPKRDYVSTEQCAWRNKLLTGEVQDRNAWAMGGVAGHAGLFGTAEAVWKLSQTLLDSVQGKSREFHAGTLQRFFMRSKRVADSSRTLGGWDTAGRDNGMLTMRFGHGCVGEFSSNGTAVWIDPVQNIVAVWLTNASHPSIEGKAEALRKLRHRFLELVVSYAATAKPEKQPTPKVAAILERIKKKGK